MTNRKLQFMAIQLSRFSFAVSRLNDIHGLYEKSTNKRQDQGKIFKTCFYSKNKRCS